MTERNVFCLIVRVVGFGSIVVGALGGMHLLILLLGLPSASTFNATAAQSATSSGAYLILGFVILAAARLITDIVYRGDRRTS